MNGNFNLTLYECFSFKKRVMCHYGIFGEMAMCLCIIQFGDPTFIIYIIDSSPFIPNFKHTA